MFWSFIHQIEEPVITDGVGVENMFDATLLERKFKTVTNFNNERIKIYWRRIFKNELNSTKLKIISHLEMEILINISY